MSVRASWKGLIKLPTHTFPVSLYPAVSGSAGISLHLMNRDTGNRLMCDWVDAGTGARVSREDRCKGYDSGDGVCVPIEEEELHAIEPEDSAIIKIEKFVPRMAIDVRYLDAPYYVAPGDASADEGVRYLRHLLFVSASCAIAKGAFFGRDRSLLLQPFDAGLIAVTLHFSHKVREAKAHYARLREAPRTKNAQPGLDWVKSKTVAFNRGELIDGYQVALANLVRDKITKRHHEQLAARNSSGGRGPKPASRRKAVTRAVH